MSSIEGMRKFSLLKTIRHATDDNTPMRALLWSSEESHCSTKTVMKRAVRAKSMPFVSKVRNEPITAPSTLPEIQYM